jgi:hypothetical protein
MFDIDGTLVDSNGFDGDLFGASLGTIAAALSWVGLLTRV